MNQHLWNALHDICGFIATQDDMDAIIAAVKKDAELWPDEDLTHAFI